MSWLTIRRRPAIRWLGIAIYTCGNLRNTSSLHLTGACEARNDVLNNSANIDSIRLNRLQRQIQPTNWPSKYGGGRTFQLENQTPFAVRGLLAIKRFKVLYNETLSIRLIESHGRVPQAPCSSTAFIPCEISGSRGLCVSHPWCRLSQHKTERPTTLQMLGSCVVFSFEPQGGGYSAKLVAPPTKNAQRATETPLELLGKETVQQGQEHCSTETERSTTPQMLGNCVVFSFEAQGGGYSAKLVAPPPKNAQRA